MQVHLRPYPYNQPRQKNHPAHRQNNPVIFNITPEAQDNENKRRHHQPSTQSVSQKKPISQNKTPLLLFFAGSSLVPAATSSVSLSNGNIARQYHLVNPPQKATCNFYGLPSQRIFIRRYCSTTLTKPETSKSPEPKQPRSSSD